LDIPDFPLVEKTVGIFIRMAVDVTPLQEECWHRAQFAFDEGDDVPLAIFHFCWSLIAECSLKRALSVTRNCDRARGKMKVAEGSSNDR